MEVRRELRGCWSGEETHARQETGLQQRPGCRGQTPRPLPREQPGWEKPPEAPPPLPFRGLGGKCWGEAGWRGLAVPGIPRASHVG